MNRKLTAAVVRMRVVHVFLQHSSSTSQLPAMNVEMGEITEKETIRPKITDAKGILQQNREFLDFFWDIAKPEQDTRLRAIEGLIQYLKLSEKVS